jgi:hypothetical protein
MWNHWQANGFKIGARPVQDWKKQINAWECAGYLPSQKQKRLNGHHHSKIDWTRHNKIAETSEVAQKLKQEGLWPNQNL